MEAEGKGAWGPIHSVSDVVASGVLQTPIVRDRTGADSTVHVSNVHGKTSAVSTVVKEAEPAGTIPNRALTVDGKAEETSWLDPIATYEEFSQGEDFSKLDVRMSYTERGVYLQVIVGDDTFDNSGWSPDKVWRGDALQFVIAPGRPGASRGDVLYDLAKVNTYEGDHELPQDGLHVYRRSFFSEGEVGGKTGLIDLEKHDRMDLAVSYEEKAREITYEFQVPWEDFGVNTPPVSDLSVDLVVTDGESYPHTSGAKWQHGYESVDYDGIFYSDSPRSAGFQWLLMEGQ